MAAKPKPTLTGTPGNMQDVRDLQQMLANLQEAHDAVVDQNSRLEAERTELRDKIEHLEEELAASKKEVDCARGDAASAEDAADELQEELAGLQDALGDRAIDVPALVQARELMRKGDHREAQFEIERILDRCDSAWRCGGCNVGELVY